MKKYFFTLLVLVISTIGCTSDDFQEFSDLSKCNQQVSDIQDEYAILAQPYSSVLSRGESLTPQQWLDYTELIKEMQSKIDSLPCKQ